MWGSPSGIAVRAGGIIECTTVSRHYTLIETRTHLGRSSRLKSKMPSRAANGGHVLVRTRAPGKPIAIDRQSWEREMNGLRRIIILLGVVLAAVIARMVIDGPKLGSGLTAAVFLALLLCSLRLRRRGRLLRPEASSETERESRLAGTDSV
jgi:hypothetical protein